MSNTLTRAELAKIFKDPRSIKVFETALTDVNTTLPQGIASADQAASVAQDLANDAQATVNDLIAILGTMAYQNSSNVTITGGAISGITSPLGIKSGDPLFQLQIGILEMLTANRLLTLALNDADRTLIVPGDTTVPIVNVTITIAGLTNDRTVTMPDDDFTVARTDDSQTFTGDQTFDDTIYANSVQVTAGVACNTLNAGATEVSTFGCNGVSAQSSYALPAAAGDPATTQALTNAIRAALIANGICS